MSRAQNRAARLLQIEALLLAHPAGISPAEIARRLMVHRSTISRCLPDLPKHIYVEDDGRWRIDREAYLFNVRFNLHEALALHLAARLLATRMDRQNPHAGSALRKLAYALEKIGPQIGRHLAEAADLLDSNTRRQDPVYLSALEKLTLAWAEGRKVKLWRRSERTGKVEEYLFSPYFIEPNAVGQSTYVIGWREPPGAERTLKIERLERVELTRERYETPPDFDACARLADAWGIWFTGAPPVEVVLRFHPRVAGRVRESRWHPSEQVEEQPDGSLLWRARVAEPKEMLPWIRGWGADCVVVGPEELKERLKEEVQRLVEAYNLCEPIQGWEDEPIT